jgi:acyl-CoA reductase-like NAD-dependent aldehyde dehydrogenase
MVMAEVVSATKMDINRAVQAARKAFDKPNSWSSWPGKKRAPFLREIAKKVDEKKQVFLIWFVFIISMF